MRSPKATTCGRRCGQQRWFQQLAPPTDRLPILRLQFPLPLKKITLRLNLSESPSVRLPQTLPLCRKCPHSALCLPDGKERFQTDHFCRCQDCKKLLFFIESEEGRLFTVADGSLLPLCGVGETFTIGLCEECQIKTVRKKR